MQYFGTFDVISQEEDEIYSRLSALRRQIELSELESNDIQQDIKMWKKRKSDAKYRLKIWGVILLICIVIATAGFVMNIMPGMPADALPIMIYISMVIERFLILIGSFVGIPLTAIVAVILLFSLLLYYVRYTGDELARGLAKLFGVKNGCVILEELGRRNRDAYVICEKLKEEQEELLLKMDILQRKNKKEHDYSNEK